MAHSPWLALGGGALIGLAAALLLVVSGRIAGVSGILGALFRPATADGAWRVAFVAGLLAGGLVLREAWPASMTRHDADIPFLWVVVAGALVGYGTQLGGGCTSGHGICGIGRFSVRSIAATLTFMATGAAATFVVQHVARGSF